VAGAPSAVALLLQRVWWAPRPTPLAMALHPLSRLYEALAALARTLTRPRSVGVPVLVIGNVVVGGAGKTPTVIAAVQMLRAYGWTPGVVSRGYGRRDASRLLEVHPDSDAALCGDEPLLVRLRSGAAVFVGQDRVAACEALRRAHPEVDLIVSDDGLQHRRLARDAQVLVFDERGVGNGLLLPAGPLRERLPVQTSPDTLVLYNAPVPSTPLPGWMARRRLAGAVPLADWVDGAVAKPAALQALRGRRVLAAAGLAVPERFFEALREAGLDDLETLPLADHHAFDPLPWPAGTTDVIVTEKDAVKLRRRETGGTRVWVAPLDFELDLGFAAALKRHFPQPPA
jgi:tetraacyldisaccharide 4'-kinase